MATINGKASYPPAPPSPTSEMGETLRTMASDVMELGSLQVRLFRAEVTAARKKIALIAVLFAIAIALGIAAATIALGGAALSLYEFAGWSLAVSVLVVGAAFLVICGIFGFLALGQLKGLGGQFRTSLRELEQNIAYVRTLISPTANLESARPFSRTAHDELENTPTI